MGFNISGLAINKKLSGNLALIESCFYSELTFQKEITFEQASTNNKPINICDIYYSDDGTIAFLNPEHLVKLKGKNGFNLLAFAIFETSDVFHYDYFEDKTKKELYTSISREITEIQGLDDIPKTDFTKSDELIFKRIDAISKINFSVVALESTAYRYKIKRLKLDGLPERIRFQMQKEAAMQLP